MQKFLRRPEVERMTGLPRSTIYHYMAKGAFPKPVPLTDIAPTLRSKKGAPARYSGASVGWIEAEIIDWQKRRIAERDQPKRRRGKSA